MKVADILSTKRASVITIKPSDTIAAFSRLIKDQRIGAAVVSSDGVHVDGMITERDVAYAIAAHPGDIHAKQVASLMTKTVITCSPQDPVGLVGSTMLSRNIRHVPVTQDERLVGMVSIRDVLKLHVSELEQTTALLLSQANRPADEPQDR